MLSKPPNPPVPLFTNNIMNVQGKHLNENIPNVTKLDKDDEKQPRRGRRKVQNINNDKKQNKPFVLPDEKVYRELLLMPATWKEGEEGNFDITIWSNVPVRIDQVQKSNYEEMKRYLRT